MDIGYIYIYYNLQLVTACDHHQWAPTIHRARASVQLHNGCGVTKCLGFGDNNQQYP